MTVKGNMPTRYKRLKKLPWAGGPAFSAVSTDHQRPRRRSRRSGSVGPGSLRDRKRPSLGQGHDLPGRQITGQDEKRAPRDGLAAQPGHQPAAHRWPLEHRRRQPPPRPRPAARATSSSDRMNDFAGSLLKSVWSRCGSPHEEPRERPARRPTRERLRPGRPAPSYPAWTLRSWKPGPARSSRSASPPQSATQGAARHLSHDRRRHPRIPGGAARATGQRSDPVPACVQDPEDRLTW
jgi:hypothetical protein